MAEAARRYGFADHVTDWRELVADDRIGLFDNVGPNNLHAEPTIAAAEAGKHVICEKPLGRDADESYETWQRVAGGRRQAHVRVQLPLRAGRAARARDDRGRRARRDPATSAAPTCRSGARPTPRSGASIAPSRAPARSATSARTWSTWPATSSARSRRSRPARNVPARGARSTTRSSRSVLRGRRDRHDRGVALRDRAQERLHVGDQRLQGLAPLRPRAPQRARGPPRRLDAGRAAQGFRTVLVSEPDHPFWEHWWPQGHMIGWEHTFVHELHHLLDGDPRRHASRPARRDARGRLPRRRGLRRDAALIGKRSPRDGEVSLT